MFIRKRLDVIKGNMIGKWLFSMLPMLWCLPFSCFGTSLEECTLAPMSYRVNYSHLDEGGLRNYLQRGGEVKEKLQVVVPVSEELFNGNLIRLLDSLNHQTTLNNNNYEVLVIVNNTLAVSKDLSHPTLIENQKTIQMLQYLRGETSDTTFLDGMAESLQETFSELTEKFKARPINIRILDKSTEGDEKFNIGRIRNAGVQQLIEEYKETGINKVIAMMDSDVACPEDYVENLLVQFINKKANSLIINIRYQVWDALNLSHFQRSYSDRYFMLWTYFDNWLKGSSPFVGSPQLVVSAETFSRLKGVPQFPKGEDIILAHQLVGIGGVRRDVNTVVRVSDRVREGGFGASGTRHKQMQEQFKPVFHDPIAYFLNHATQVAIYSQDGSYQELLQDFIYDAPSDLLGEWNQYAKHEQGLGDALNDSSAYNESLMKKPIEELPTYQYLKRYLPKEEFQVFQEMFDKEKTEHNDERKKLLRLAREIHRRWQAEESLVSKDRDSLAVKEFFRMNPWIESEIKKLLDALPAEESGNFSSVQSLLESQFPDYFAPFEEAFNKQQIIITSLFTSFMDRAEMEPEKFPDALWIGQAMREFFKVNVGALKKNFTRTSS